jgi:hypothetical protein
MKSSRCGCRSYGLAKKYNLGLWICLLLMGNLTSSAVLGQGSGSSELVTVIADGVGDTPQSAVQNAIEAALKNVLGSYIDTERKIEETTTVRDGKRSEFSEIENITREYSRGAIKKAERLQIINEGGLFKAVVKVSIKVIR